MTDAAGLSELEPERMLEGRKFTLVKLLATFSQAKMEGLPPGWCEST